MYLQAEPKTVYIGIFRSQLILFYTVSKQDISRVWHGKGFTGPLADSHEIKGFYKGYFRQNKGCFIEILTKIKSKLTPNCLVYKYQILILKSML